MAPPPTPPPPAGPPSIELFYLGGGFGGSEMNRASETLSSRRAKTLKSFEGLR